MNIFKRLRNWRWAQQRATDIKFVWPICRANAASLEDAHEDFAKTIAGCACWEKHYGPELWEAICKLE